MWVTVRKGCGSVGSEVDTIKSEGHSSREKEEARDGECEGKG